MGSNSKDVQLAQKERANQELAARLATLKEKGVSDEAVEKDRTVRHLKAKIKELGKRVVAIDEQEAILKKSAEAKAKRLAQPKQKKKKSKKAEPPPKQGGKKKKKKAKKKS